MPVLFSVRVGEWIAHRAKLQALDKIAASTLKNQSRIARMFAEAWPDKAPDEIRKSHIELWAAERGRFCGAVTVSADLDLLRQVLNWLKDERLLAELPRFPSVSVTEAEKALPPDAAFLWTLAAVPGHHALALEFMMLMGLAPHELERLQVQDGKGDLLEIGLRPDFRVKQEVRRRRVPMNGRAQDIWFEVTAGMAPADVPFPSLMAMQKAISRARQATRNPPPGAGDICPKMMRKWFASKLASQGLDGSHQAQVPEHVLQRLLGHAPGSRITRKHYIRSADDQLASAVGALAA